MFKEDIEAIVSHLENLVSTKTIIGEPIVSGNSTIIPVLTASVGFGVGSGEGNQPSQGTGKGSGGGAGLKLTPAAMIVIQGDEVKVYSLSQKGMIDKLGEMLPTVFSQIKKEHNGNGCCDC